jgi:hypothetical protein
MWQKQMPLSLQAAARVQHLLEGCHAFLLLIE